MSDPRIAVYDGGLVNPFLFTKDDLPIEMIAHSLSQLNRYTGHALFPYSVAQHTSLLIDIVPRRLKRAAAMHDWSETLMSDIAHPIKRELPEYMRVESVIQERIFDEFEEPWENMEAVTPFDRRICADEMRVLFPKFDPEWIKYEPLGVKVEEWTWRQAKHTLIMQLKDII